MIAHIDPLSRRRLRVALVGPGAHARRDILPALLMQRDAEICVIASRHLDHARHVAEEYEVDGYTDRWQDVVDRGRVDIVVATATAKVHAELLHACLAAGVPVFVDKPPAPDLPTLQKLAKLEARASSAAFIGYNFAFSAPVRRFVEALTADDRIARMRVQFVTSRGNDLSRRYGSAVEALLLEGGTHAVDLATRCLGPAVDVSAFAAALSETAHVVNLILSHRDGAQSKTKRN